MNQKLIDAIDEYRTRCMDKVHLESLETWIFIRDNLYKEIERYADEKVAKSNGGCYFNTMKIRSIQEIETLRSELKKRDEDLKQSAIHFEEVSIKLNKAMEIIKEFDQHHSEKEKNKSMFPKWDEVKESILHIADTYKIYGTEYWRNELQKLIDTIPGLIAKQGVAEAKRGKE